MISEVAKMIHFCDAASVRLTDLRNLAAFGFVRKRFGLGNSSIESVPQTVVIQSLGAFIRAIKTVSYTERVWGTSQWKLRSETSLPHPMDFSLLKKAKDMTLGISSYEGLATLWEILPWSWFIDWFFQFGSVIQAANNTVSTQWSNLCLMRTLTSKSRYQVETQAPSDTWAHLDGSLYTAEIRKERYIGISPAGPPVTLLAPLIKGKTWSILGSLVVLNPKSLKFRL